MNKPLIRSTSYRGINTTVAFVGVVLFFSVFTPNHLFLDSRNLSSIARLAPDLGVVTLGIGMLLIAREFDLSISSIIPICAFIFALLLEAGMYPLAAFFVTLPVGAAMGFLNGVIVVKTGLPSFIITLSTMMFWRGVLFGASRMMPRAIRRYFPANSLLNNAMTMSVGPIPIQILWLLFFTVILGLLLHKHKFGNWIYAVGSNQDAARAMGVNVALVKIVLYTLVGTLCAFAAIMQATRLGSFSATQGARYELQAIAAVVVGGASLRGGVGSIGGILLGLLIVKSLENGLILMRVPVFGVEAFIGIAVILFVILNEYLNRRTE
ncbi:MAG: ABC transporter permease [Spirochaetaceae bacterium]|nr:MAG: ABC transporter permease [Spirochaetaceae bacterium]